MCTCNQNINPCSCVQVEPNCSPCDEAKVCPINLDTSCIFYNLYTDTSKLTCLALSNGVSLTQILEAIDTKLCQVLPSIPSYNLPCLRNDYVITNFKQFSEAVDEEFCTMRVELENLINTNKNNISSLSTLVTSIYTPALTDCGTIGLTPGDTIIQVLQKYANKICNIQATCCSDNSPSIIATNSQSILFTTSGTKNHNITASVQKSNVLGNLLQIFPDGLYCSVSVPNYTQVLSFNSLANTISLSNGGGSIILNTDLDNQLLSFNCVSKILTISNGNSVNLSCLSGSGSITETPLVAIDTPTINFTTSGTNGHILTGDVLIPGLISSTVNNSISINAGGLYSIDEKVKLNSLDATPGYLETKLSGKINSLISTVVSSNNTTNKAEFESVLDVAALLSTISSNPVFLNTFTNLVKSVLCFKFRIKNTNSLSETYSYVDCSGVSYSSLSLSAGASIDICGESANTLSSFVTINNLGYC
jgi:hypothetical protein